MGYSLFKNDPSLQILAKVGLGAGVAPNPLNGGRGVVKGSISKIRKESTP
jgi:hypothetical protein